MLLSRTSVLAILASAGFGAVSACGASDTPVSQPAAVEEPDAQGEAALEDHAGEAHDEEAEGAAEDHDDDHDHDHEASGAGSAHVHGVGDLALSWEGNRLIGELISPLANFGLSEAEGVISDAVLSELPGLAMITGGNCVAEPPAAKVDKSSGHTDAHINLAWNCSNPSGVSALTFSGFPAFSSFERVNAIYLTDTVQKAGELSPSSPTLSLK